jgi:ribokinase
MTNFLSDILVSDHPLFTRTIAEFEKASGNEGVDTRLIADITEKAHAAMRALGLDPADTSAEELYHALSASVLTGDAAKVLKECDYVLLRFTEGPVSFNEQDVVENAHHELPFGDRIVGHAQRHLRAEIIKRYADHDRTDNEMVHALAEQAGLKPPEDEGHRDMNHATDNSNAPRLLAIGDIFTDAFIKLDEHYAVVETDSEGKEWLKLPFGSKPPYEQVDIVRSVGPSPNAAVSCARLGLDVQLMAWLGDDEHGKNSLAHLKKENIDTAPMVTQPNSKSSYWYVLRHGSERTMLVKSEAYEYAWTAPVRTPEWIYLAYIGKDSWPLHESLDAYLAENPEIKFVFQPATYHFEWGIEKLGSLYKKAYMVVMNREEAMQVTNLPHDNVRALADGLHTLGPAVVVITDGSHGSYASFDGKLVTIPNYPDPAPPLDRTGAGDAFASSIVAGIAMGKSVEEALTWAPINSMSVVQSIGAQAGLLNREKIDEYLASAPEDYKVTEVTD